MRKWIWLLPAIALWNVMPAAQAQYGPRYGPRLWQQPGRYEVRNSLLTPPPGASPTLQGIYRDAQIAAAPWQNRPSQGIPILRLGPLSPCGPQDPFWPQSAFGPQSPFGPQSAFGGPHGIIPREPRVSDFLGQKQNGNTSSSASVQIPPELPTQVFNPAPNINLPLVFPSLPPVDAPARHDPFAALSWLRWEWVAGIFILGLLVCLLREYRSRKRPNL